MAVPVSYKMHVEGMDCASCASKIETALKRLPGVSDIEVNPTTGLLRLDLDEDRTRLADVTSRIRMLGYTPHAEDHGHGRDGGGGAHRHFHDHSDVDGAWWKGRKARLVLLTGLLFALAASTACRNTKPCFMRWRRGSASCHSCAAP
jgi:Cd2+/Zn2+-exporting ATPase